MNREYTEPDYDKWLEQQYENSFGIEEDEEDDNAPPEPDSNEDLDDY